MTGSDHPDIPSVVPTTHDRLSAIGRQLPESDFKPGPLVQDMLDASQHLFQRFQELSPKDWGDARFVTAATLLALVDPRNVQAREEESLPPMTEAAFTELGRGLVKNGVVTDQQLQMLLLPTDLHSLPDKPLGDIDAVGDQLTSNR